ncbi:type II toxin-antitoxin system Phd/YefM family antitoxin [Microlunatus endophyticus]|nr:type II toxin-antitoxin system prevent-host-death family antitoxin [Microlunatus endophyticus]
MPRVTAREASRGFAALLDRVEHDGEEYVVVRDGREVARIVPAGTHTLESLQDALDDVPALDLDFERDALGANRLLTMPSDPWLD